MIAPLTNYNFMDYYNDDAAFGGVFSRDNVPQLSNRFYIINLDDLQGPGTHWVVVFNIGKPCIYFDSFAVPPPKEVIKRMLKTKKDLVRNTYRIQDLTSDNCGFFCIYVIDELQKNRQLIDILVDFEPLDYKKNDDFINEIF